MDEVLRPYRSLSAQAFRILLIVVIVMNVGVAAVFAARGAFPVAGFLGLDVAALWLAFHINYRAARACEHVRISAREVHVASISASGKAVHWVVNPLWAYVRREKRGGVVIRAGTGEMRLGAFLPPKQREAFAAALDVALYRAKRGA